MERRDVLRWLSVSAVAGCAQLVPEQPLVVRAAQPKSQLTLKLPRIKITDITTILTAPNQTRLVIVKVSTSEPGLYGVGCATFTQRSYAVQTAVEKYLKPFLAGQDVDQIEDIWQSSYVSSYWRNGPVLFNAMSGVDMALWDIKGKRANMPLYQLMGGKCRFGAALYAHVQGRNFKEVEENTRQAMAKGYRHVRVQVAIPGLATYGAAVHREPTQNVVIGPTNPKDIWEPGPYLRTIPKLFEHLLSPDRKTARNSGRTTCVPLSHFMVRPCPLERVGVEPVVFLPRGHDVINVSLAAGPRPAFEVAAAERMVEQLAWSSQDAWAGVKRGRHQA